MKFCSNCGNQLFNEPKFCSGCGSKMPEIIPQQTVSSHPVAETKIDEGVAVSVGLPFTVTV